MGMFGKARQFKIKFDPEAYLEYQVYQRKYLFLGMYDDWTYEKGFGRQQDAENFIEQQMTADTSPDPKKKAHTVKIYK